MAVNGAARSDADFEGGSDTVSYKPDVTGFDAPFTVSAALWYQPIGWRWAENLGEPETVEARRFRSYFEGMSSGVSALLAKATRTVRGR